MKISLCSVPSRLNDPVSNPEDRQAIPKLGIIRLVNWMEKHGYTPEQYDFYDIDILYPNDDVLKKYFQEYQPTVIGLSAVVSTSYLQVKRISRIIREVCPDAWIVVGGHLASSANVILRKTEADLCVVGDGERPWVTFLDYVKKYNLDVHIDQLKLIQGVAFIADDDLHFTGFAPSVPIADDTMEDYNFLKLGLKDQPHLVRKFFDKGRDHLWFHFHSRARDPERKPYVADLTVAKGCVGHCTFCQRSTKGYRPLDLQKLEEHIVSFKNEHDVGFITLSDENFGSNKKHSYKFAKIMKKHNMLWMAGGIRCKNVNYDDLKFYQECGLTGVKLGVESGSQKILDIMEKRFTVEDVYNALYNCAQLGLWAPLAFMVGMPGETEETARETGIYLGNVAHMIGVHPEIMGNDVLYALAIPSTPLYTYAQQIGLIGKTVEEEEKYLEMIGLAYVGKDYYLNHNGAPISEVLFWDYLIRLEASRTYRQQCKISQNETPLKRIYEMNSAKRQKVVRPLKLKIRNCISLFINDKIIGNAFVDSLPRKIVYPIIKYLIYVEYLIVKCMKYLLNRKREFLFSKDSFNNIRIDEKTFNSFSKSRERSLRNIIRIKQDDTPEPQTITGKSLRILYRGL